MSILIRVLPFWIGGILASWAFPSLVGLLLIWKLLIWVLLVTLCALGLLVSSKALPAVSILVLGLAFLSSFIITTLNSGHSDVPTGRKMKVWGRVVKVWEGEKSDRLKIKLISYSVDDAQSSCGEFVLLQTGKKLNESPRIGDFIASETKLSNIEKRTSPGEFPERMYWSGEGIRKKGWINSFERSDSLSKVIAGPLSYARKYQTRLSELIDHSSIDQARVEVIKAMLLGKKDGLSTELKDVFRQTGISHLLAVSGLHVGLIYIIIISILSFLKRLRMIYIAEVLALVIVWFYAFMTGFGPSVQRAAGMISLFSLSRMINRRVEPMQILVFAFIIQTSLDPFAIFRFGFQLSYLAVGGIMLAYGPWTRLVKFKHKVLSKVWNYAGVSLSAQTLTIPFILVYFHEFPIYFLIGNLILVPLGLIIFYLGAAYLAVLSAGICIPIIEKILDIVIGIMVGIGEAISALPGAIIGFESFLFYHIPAYYLFIGLFFVKRISMYRRFVWVFSLFLIFSALGLIVDFWNMF